MNLGLENKRVLVTGNTGEGIADFTDVNRVQASYCVRRLEASTSHINPLKP